MKSIQVFLDEKAHGDFKAWCARHGTNMQRRIVDLIDANNGTRAVVKPGTMQPVGVEKAPVVVPEPPQPAQHPLMRDAPYVEPPEMKKCAKCFDVFPVETLVPDPKTRKLYCESCVEDMKNGQ